tara:strand:- start:35613 stop:35804 length:192 start_codon:yes stop_codon:yes gene_type:complete
MAIEILCTKSSNVGKTLPKPLSAQQSHSPGEKSINWHNYNLNTPHNTGELFASATQKLQTSPL